jgi:D-glycero-D-manno-heptose 1,7-bisphosphate phosphatase
VERLNRPAAFLDRDGTINRRPAAQEYVTRIEEFEILPGAIAGMARLASCGLELIVVSNQRGIARGLVAPGVLDATEVVIQGHLREHGADVAEFRYCPHEIDEDCECRKPKPGMLLDVARSRRIELEASWMIGDSQSDVEAGAAAGCRTVGIGPDALSAEFRAESLLDAAAVIGDELQSSDSNSATSAS